MFAKFKIYIISAIAIGLFGVFGWLWTQNVVKTATIEANKATIEQLTTISLNQTKAIASLEQTMKENEQSLRDDVLQIEAILGKYRELSKQNEQSLSALEESIKGIDDVKIKECMVADVPDTVFDSLFKPTEARSDKRSGSNQ